MKIQQLSDKTAICLSFLCVVHCLLLPVLLIVLPPISGLLALNDEMFHQWLLFAVVPISLIALYMGYLHHKNKQVFIVGSIGLGILAMAAFLGHDILGEHMEVIVTVMGSSIIAFAHVRNYQLRCQDQCDLPNH